MSQIYKSMASGPVPPTLVETLTGNNNAVAVGPSNNNINIVGSGGIIVTGNSGSSTLTITSVQTLLTGTATTTGAATALINASPPIPIVVPNNSCVSVRANIAGFDTTSGLAVGGEIIGLAKNVSGTVTIVATPDRTKNSDMPLSDVTWTLVVSGGNVFIQVSGTASGAGSDIIQWRAVIDTVSAP